MVAEDLDVLCSDILQWSFLQVTSLSPILLRHSNVPSAGSKRTAYLLEASRLGTPRAITTKIQLQNPHGKKLDDSIRARLLDSFTGAIAGGQRVVFMNCAMEETMKALQKRMGASMVCGAGLVWLFHDLLQKLTAKSYSAMNNGQHKRVLAICDMVTIMVKHFPLLGLSTSEIDPEFEVPTALVIYSIMDLSSNTLIFCLKANAMDECELLMGPGLSMQGLLDTLPRQHLFSPSLGRCLLGPQVFMWGTSLVWALTAKYKLGVLDGLNGMTSLRPFVTDSRLLDRLDHDIDLLQQWSHMSSGELILYTSVHKFPHTIFSTPAPVGCEKPAGIDGVMEPGLCKQFFAAHPDLKETYGYEA
ncbi:hypothetical protein LTR86_010562 [Recurvomyces mirabilis]|nr:hypothetical protein LTR86_010562 [Recurvomyces mirabilis]